MIIFHLGDMWHTGPFFQLLPYHTMFTFTSRNLHSTQLTPHILDEINSEYEQIIGQLNIMPMHICSGMHEFLRHQKIYFYPAHAEASG